MDFESALVVLSLFLSVMTIRTFFVSEFVKKGAMLSLLVARHREMSNELKKYRDFAF